MILSKSLRICIIVLALMFIFNSSYAYTNDNVSQIFATTLGQNADATAINVTFDNETIIHSLFGHSNSVDNSRLNVSQTGLYKLSYGCSWDSTGANGRHIMENWLRVNSTSDIVPSKTSCYIRQTGSDGDRCSNSGVVLYNLSDGDYVELIGSKLQGTAGATVTYDDCYIYAQRVRNEVVQVYDSTGGDNFDANTVTVNLDTQTYADSIYSLGTDSVNVSEDGWYKIYYHICSETTGQNNRQTPRGWLRINGNENISSSYSYSYLRETSVADRGCNVGYVLHNLTSGDYVEMQIDKYAKEGNGATITLADQSWMLIEKVESDSSYIYESTMSQVVSANANDAITFNTNYKIGNYVSHASSNSRIYFARDGLYEIGYNLGWQDDEGNDRIIVCGYLRKNGADKVTPSQQCDYSRGDAQAKWGSVNSNVVMNVSKGDYIELVANPTGSSAYVFGNATSVSLIKLDEKPEVMWNVDSLFIGNAIVNLTNVSNTASMSSYRINNNTKISCMSGDCSMINVNASSAFNLIDGEIKLANFSCDNSAIGTFYAIYGINSSQDNTNSLINVSCKVYDRFGTLGISLIEPPAGTYKLVAQNRTFNIIANLSCSGTNVSCGNVSLTAMYNKTRGTFGSGKDGSISVSALNTIVNNYTYLVSNANATDNVISVNDASQFSEGDEILIIQMQNSSQNVSAGTFEYAFIQSISGNDLTLESSIDNDYRSGVFDTTSAVVTQILSVPHFTDVNISSGSSITAPSWNGYVGGIVVFRASGTVNTSGYINVSEKGFRGGDCNGCGNNAWGDSGEGYTGLGTSSLSANTCGGGGGYGPSGFGGEPGAGGGYGTAGGNGVASSGNHPIGGSAAGDANLSVILFGGGAGAGGDNDNVAPFPEYVDGGGIVIVHGYKLVNARITAKGETGFYPGGAGGTAGSGAGGTIWLVSDNMNLSDVDASGGPQVIGAGPDRGGAGGDGRVRLDYNTISGSSTPASGYDGAIDGEILMRKIPVQNNSVPLWSISSNPQYCSLNSGESCLVTWTVNATGPINTSYLVNVFAESNITLMPEKVTGNATINITANIFPEITLYEPVNSSKIITNGNVTFLFLPYDDENWANCSFYINNVLNRTTNCSTGINNTINLSLSRGHYNWSVSVRDTDNNSISSAIWDFYVIDNYSMRVTKSILSENTGMYKIKVVVKNLLNIPVVSTLLDFVDRTFNYGSFNVAADFTNSTNGALYNGTVLGWDLNYAGNSSLERNYSIAGVGNYTLKNNYVVGLD